MEQTFLTFKEREQKVGRETEKKEKEINTANELIFQTKFSNNEIHETFE